MWLLPIIFMLHDFEEIIMFKPWLNANWSNLERRFPRIIINAMSKQRKLSGSAFAVAVAEEFTVLSVITLVAVELDLYHLWTGLMLGFFIHLLVHVGQFVVHRRYVPVIITSLPAGLYCIAALHDLNLHQTLDWGTIIFWTVLFVIFIAVNMVLAIRLSERFDRWLGEKYPGSS